MTETLVLVDGNALVHRAFHAVPPLTTRQGELVNAAYGFTSMLLKAIADLHPSYVAVAFDLAAPTFRHKEFEAYKAQRPKGSDELFKQFRRVRQIVSALNIPVHELEGFEADDVLGTLAKQAAAKGVDTVILTGDADALQLVQPRVRVLMPRKGVSDVVFYDEIAVRERYGVSAAQVADLKALVGDTSDNIPGVPGVGEKTAAKLLTRFENVENLLAHLDDLDEKQRDLITKHAVQIAQSKRLATIVTSVPVELDLQHVKIGVYDRDEVLELFRELEFRSLLARLPAVAQTPVAMPVASPAPSNADGEQMSLFDLRGESIPSNGAGPGTGDSEANGYAGEGATSQHSSVVCGPPLGQYQLIQTTEQLDRVIDRLEAARGFAFDTETDNIMEMRANLVGIAVSDEIGSGAYIPVGHLASNGTPFRQLPIDYVLDRLRPLLEDPARPKYGHNGKYDLTVLERHGVHVRGLAFDSMVAAYVLQATQRAFGLKDLAFSLFGLEMTPITALIGTGKKQLTMAQVPIDQVAQYAGADADVTYRLVAPLETDLRREGLWSLFTELELPLVPVLSRMEQAGIALDVAYLRQFSDQLHHRIVTLETEIYQNAGHRFNINSTQQLAQVLYKELNLDTKRKTKLGQSTAADVLDGLRGAHPVVDLLLEYRQLVKLKSTYVDALPLLLHPESSRLHTSFNQTGTVTGRLSSSDPNLQNIPIRTELGRQVRRAFIAGSPDSVLLSADYSQIELRILAHISQDPGLIQAFASGEDIHAATASQIFGAPIGEVTAEMRRMAKTINFGIVYGISDYGLSERIGISRREAADFIEKYFGRYPGVRVYIDDTRRKAERDGYVETLLHRRRGIPEIKVQHRGAREAALRTAINAPIQGTAADIIKRAMITLDEAIGKRGLRAQMLLQVHDELVFEVPASELDEVRHLVKQEMEGAMTLDVAVVVDLKHGQNWADMH